MRLGLIALVDPRGASHDRVIGRGKGRDMTNAHDFSTENSNGRLCLRGELDVLGSAALRRTLNGLRGQVAVLDLAEVTFIDGRGLRVLLDARDAQRDLRLENPSPRFIRLLKVTGLTDALLGCETFTDA